MNQMFLVLPDFTQVDLHLIITMWHRLFRALLATINRSFLVSDTLLSILRSIVHLLLILDRIPSCFL